MIVKIKKRSLILLLIVIIVSLPLVYAAASIVRVGFKVELVISNRNPTITFNNITTSLGSSQFSVDPTATGATSVLISFNVTDADGVTQINASKAVVNFTLGAFSQWYANVTALSTSEFGTCSNSTQTSTIMVINCTVVLPYYVNASSSWRINISVQDTQGGTGRNDSAIFTVNTVSSISLPNSFANFSNVNLGQNNVLAYPHLLLNNTGNDDFGQVNMTAAALVGTTTTTENIAVTNFGVNLTNSSSNQYITFPANGIVNLRDTATGGNVSFRHGHTSAFAPNADKGNISAFLWVNVPSSGLSSQLYNATWNVTAVTTP